ncbi:hypothetical protein BDN70DRAFT_876989 [Pholiota conissans]|uniref:Oxidoreductase AflY n=1 Tax=Pholiota conissans TaxID=109636 RepID=A0A9P5Z509_9AGAR|nr:hypothetical protein BDN70DRAFT_876989 [Pholiota conissans]
MAQLSYTLSRKGQLNFPGITAASKQAVEELLLKDAEEHHCYFRQSGFHNHLSHHILAAYDLGAPAGHLKAIYADEAKTQRPKFVEERDKSITVQEDNWKQYLGNQSAYGSFVQFFSNAVAELGVNGTFEKYVFSEEANREGAEMLNRVMAGAVHPMIQIGYGAEFGNDTLIATGLAQAAIHVGRSYFHVSKSPPEKNVTLLELLDQVYASEVLKPIPYDPDAFIGARMSAVMANGGAEEIERLCANYHISDDISDAELAKKSEELIWVATLLTFSTGRKGRKPRLDFFLMHFLTSSLFVRPLCAVIERRENKAAFLRAYLPVIMLVMLMRGRPRINAELVMEFNPVPRPPLSKYPSPVKEALGNPAEDAEYNPWPALIEGVRYHSDSHVLKAMRSLVFGAQHFGDTPPGGVLGAFHTGLKEKRETHVGMGKVDGTIFVRAAGVLMETLGWSGYGQPEGEWDRSALGWDKAWDSN